MLAIDTETTGLFIHKGCRAFTITATCDQFKNYLWRFPVDPFTRNVIYSKPKLEHFFDTVANHEELVFHNANFDIQVLDALGLSIETLFSNHDIHDTMVMSHAYKANNPHGLKQLGVMLLGMPEDDEAELAKHTIAAQHVARKLKWAVADKHKPHPSLLGTQKEWYKTDYWIPKEVAERTKLPQDHPWHTVCDTYATKDTERTLGIYLIFQKLMADDQVKAYNKARRLIKPILNMQNEGVTLLTKDLYKATTDYRKKAATQLQKLRNISGRKEFNPNSPKQLGDVLFKQYKFKTNIIGKSGNPSANKEVISQLLADAPTEGKLPDRYRFLLELKTQRKTKTTLQYIENYVNHRIHDNVLIPFFKQWSTGTGRLSCENPNTTNVGKDDMNNPYSAKETGITGISAPEDSFKLRNVFGPRADEIWTCIDYQQFQLLIFAVVSDSKPLLKAFEEGADAHHAVARELFKTDNISAIQRTAAKAINFGLLFGAGPAKIEQIAGIPGLYNLFLSKFPKAKSYLNARAQEARRKGYVYTLGGYRLYVPKDRLYAAPCYVIQGSEAEIVRDAMVDIDNYTYSSESWVNDIHNKKERYSEDSPFLSESYAVNTNNPYRQIMMVHDELVFRSNRTSHKHLSDIMNIMENAALKVGVPAKVDADIVVDTWAEKKSYVGPCEDCGEAVVSWKSDGYTYQDCIGCNPQDIGLIY